MSKNSTAALSETADLHADLNTAPEREIYRNAVDAWLDENATAPTLGHPDWMGHLVGLRAVADAARKEGANEVLTNILGEVTTSFSTYGGKPTYDGLTQVYLDTQKVKYSAEGRQ